MKEKEYIKKRLKKQYIMTVLFLVILAAGWFYPLLLVFMPLCMLAGVGIAYKKGRKWCDWYCPRGSFYDALVSKISPKKDIPAFFKNFHVRFGVLIFLITALTLQIAAVYSDIDGIFLAFLKVLTVTTAAGIIFAFFFHQRTFCYICPVGTLSNLAGKNKKPLLITSEKCNLCGRCYKTCPMKIKPYSFKKEGVNEVKDADCLKCGICVNVCPQNALSGF